MKTVANLTKPKPAIPNLSKKGGIVKRKKKGAAFQIEQDTVQGDRNVLKKTGVDSIRKSKKAVSENLNGVSKGKIKMPSAVLAVDSKQGKFNASNIKSPKPSNAAACSPPLTLKQKKKKSKGTFNQSSDAKGTDSHTSASVTSKASNISTQVKEVTPQPHGNQLKKTQSMKKRQKKQKSSEGLSQMEKIVAPSLERNPKPIVRGTKTSTSQIPKKDFQPNATDIVQMLKNHPKQSKISQSKEANEPNAMPISSKKKMKKAKLDNVIGESENKIVSGASTGNFRSSRAVKGSLVPLESADKSIRSSASKKKKQKHLHLSSQVEEGVAPFTSQNQKSVFTRSDTETVPPQVQRKDAKLNAANDVPLLKRQPKSKKKSTLKVANEATANPASSIRETKNAKLVRSIKESQGKVSRGLSSMKIRDTKSIVVSNSDDKPMKGSITPLESADSSSTTAPSKKRKLKNKKVLASLTQIEKPAAACIQQNQKPILGLTNKTQGENLRALDSVPLLKKQRKRNKNSMSMEANEPNAIPAPAKKKVKKDKLNSNIGEREEISSSLSATEASGTHTKKKMKSAKLVTGLGHSKQLRKTSEAPAHLFPKPTPSTSVGEESNNALENVTTSSGVLGKRKKKDPKSVTSAKKNQSASANSLPPEQPPIKKKKRALKPKANALSSEQPPIEKKKRGLKPEGLESNVTKGRELLPDVVEKVSAATLKVVKDSQDQKQDLFSSHVPITMHFVAYQIPVTPVRQIRCKVPHSLLPPDPDICLIVRDMERGPKTDEEHTRFSEAYSELLRDQGNCGIKEVLPLSELRSKYKAFEMKRRLAKTFDMFLCDGGIQGRVQHFLGKIFTTAKKIPIPIQAMERTGSGKLVFVRNLKDKVKDAMHKVGFTLHDHGSSYAVQVGHSMHTVKQLSENVIAVWKALKRYFPAGVKNIRTVYLKGPNTIGVPLYASLALFKGVAAVKNPKKISKKNLEFEELSTHLGKKVVVLPSGNIRILNKPNAQEIAFSKETDEMDEEQKKKWRQRKNKDQTSDASLDEKENDGDSPTLKDSDSTKRINKEDASREVSDDEEDVDDAENQYLSTLQE